MSIKGLKVELTAAEGHPKAFIDALYKEFFDLHPDASYVDLAVAVNDTTTDEEREAKQRATFEVIDARIMRVTDPAFDDIDRPLSASEHRYLDDSGKTDEGPFGMLREMVRWASSLDGRLIWVRKSPEGINITEQAFAWGEALGAIDFATGNGKTKQYRLGVVTNRNESWPLPHGGIPQANTGFADIDIAITEKVVRHPIEKYGLGADSAYAKAAEEHIAAQRVISGHELEHGMPHHMAAHETLTRTAKVMGREAAKAVLASPDTSEKEKATAQTMLSMVELHEMMEQAATRPPQNPFGLPNNIMSLPQFQLPAQDNTKPRIGFRSPEERDRLN